MAKSKVPTFLLAAALLSGCRTSSFKWVDNPAPTAQTTPTATPDEPKEIVPDTSPATPIVSSSTALPTPVKGPVTPPVVKDGKVTETFVQKGKSGLVDILIVIDDSGTMVEEQTNLSTKLSDLLASISDTDWQIGVITTTVAVENDFDVCRLTLIKPTDANYQEKFRQAVTPGTNGSNNEEGIRQAVNGLRCDRTPWVRPNASVAVLIVSDEDNCSSRGKDCFKQPSSTEQYLIHYVENDMQRIVGVNAGFYGIFSPVNAPCATAENIGYEYQALVEYNANGQTNYGNICDASYKSTLNLISSHIARLLINQFPLSKRPVAGTLTVNGKKASGEAITDSDYQVSGSILNFAKGDEPALNSTFTVTYEAVSN